MMDWKARREAMVIDSTSLNCYQNCPRRFFFRYILGWTEEWDNHDLFYGQCIHKGMEVLMREGLSQETLEKAVAAFRESYLSVYSLMDEDRNAPKNLANGCRTLSLYVDRYQLIDDFTNLHTEVAGSVPVSEDHPERVLYFRLDSVNKDALGVFVMDHKTAKSFSRGWIESWIQDTQIMTYLHALEYYYGDCAPVRGVIVNGLTICNPPAVRKDGQPYANSRDTEFLRVTVTKSWDQMEAWLCDINRVLDDLDQDWDRLIEHPKESVILDAFHRRPTHCVHKYGTCPYLSYCSAWANPARDWASPPSGFKVEFWDPRQELQQARVVVSPENKEVIPNE